MRSWFRLASLGFALAGFSKVMALPQQRRLFRSWGWPEDTMLIIGGLELGGALLMSSRRTRHIGAATVTAVSVAVLAAELEHGQTRLAPGRYAMIAAALTGIA
jgi:VanZ family protein